MKQSVIKRLFYYIRPYRRYMILAVFCAVIGISLSLYIPVLIGKGVDLLASRDLFGKSEFIKVIVTLAAVIMVSAVFQWVFAYFANKITYHAVRDIRVDVFDKLNHLPLKYIDKTPHGDLTNRIVNDADFVADGLLQGITQLFTGIFTILGTLVFMLLLNPLITLVVVLITPLSIFVSGFIAKRTHETFLKQSKTQGEIGGYITERITNQKLIKAFLYEKESQEGFCEINQRLYTLGQKAQFMSSISNPSTRFVNGIVYAGVGVIGAISAIGGNISIGQIASFLAYANQYTKPFNEVTGILTQLQTAFSAASRLFSVLDEESQSDDEERQTALNNIDGRVSLKNVAFSYTPDRPLIKDLNLEVKKGGKVAIVGPTGSGKTTLVNLLMRFYDVDAGEILVDGINIKDIKKDGLRKSFGMVLQETWLFSGTIAQNIAFAKPDATEDEIINAAKAAYAHSFIERLPNGYDTVITGGGSNLSNGQKQLLAIARIMLIHPPMLILDEATSSIDTRTELLIQKAFDKIMEGRTSFVVAHRLSTIKEADVILVMQNGSIVEQGKHEELLLKNGFYAQIYNSQFAAS